MLLHNIQIIVSLQVAEQQGHIGFGQASDQYRFVPKAQLTATIDNWGLTILKR